MKTLVTVNDQHEAVIPEAVIRSLQLEPGSQVEVEVGSFIRPELPQDEESRRLRNENFRAVLEEYRGTGHQQMLDDGYASVDELMADIRPEW